MLALGFTPQSIIAACNSHAISLRVVVESPLWKRGKDRSMVVLQFTMNFLPKQMLPRVLSLGETFVRQAIEPNEILDYRYRLFE